MIDFDSILTKFVEVASEVVGSQLSQTDGFPSIIRSRNNEVKPDYPYIVIDILDVRMEDAWLVEEYVAEGSCATTVDTVYDLLMSYTVYGEDLETLTIANQLEGFFRFDRVRGDIRNSLSASIVQTSPIQQRTYEIPDRLIATTVLPFTINVVDSSTDTKYPDNGTIESIGVSGSLKESVDDPSPLTFSTTITKP